MEVGLRIYEQAARRQPGQIWLKRVVAEMGGKDAIIVDESADLEDAASGIVTSAFGFQGQKCSACSRAIVVDSVYDEVLRRGAAAVLPEAVAVNPYDVDGLAEAIHGVLASLADERARQVWDARARGGAAAPDAATAAGGVAEIRPPAVHQAPRGVCPSGRPRTPSSRTV